jgi:hypothetical protein
MLLFVTGERFGNLPQGKRAKAEITINTMLNKVLKDAAPCGPVDLLVRQSPAIVLPVLFEK